jgi:YnbE-like lipoprotein
MKRIPAMVAVSVAVGCSPIVRVEAPREPITINVNVKLDADVRVKLEEQAHKDIAKNPEIF